PKDLAAHMEMTTGGVTAIAQRLVELDLLERIAHPDDRRSLYLELTLNGHSVMNDMHSDFIGMVAGSTSMLDADQLVAFESALTVVATEVFARTAR
ncbi:MAG: MarR family transcriptional regulator, partial [Salinibacterium sp.]|nr:MarR family transcriptional regulator [Salinibacterium sp.]